MDENRLHASIRNNEKIKNIQEVIKDARKFNEKISDEIKKTDRFLHTTHPKISRGTIRNMIEQDNYIKNQTIINNNEIKYQKAKIQYDSDLHNIMEKIITMKKKYPC